MDELMLEFKSGDKEEDGEETVGGPCRQTQVEPQSLGADRDGTEVEVGIPPGGVGPDEGDDGGDQQEDPADGLAAQCAQEPDALGQARSLEGISL